MVYTLYMYVYIRVLCLGGEWDGRPGYIPPPDFQVYPPTSSLPLQVCTFHQTDLYLPGLGEYPPVPEKLAQKIIGKKGMCPNFGQGMCVVLYPRLTEE